jgi:hypothetical protein
MGQPFPPQGNQTPHTERPLKVYAEQYLAGADVPIGVEIGPGDPPDFTEAARVTLPTGRVVVALTDWVISNRYTGRPSEVVSAEEFSERFGGGGPPLPEVET